VLYDAIPPYLFDPPSNPCVPFGEGFFEPVAPLPPWHGEWNLLSAPCGLPDAGTAAIETETLPDGRKAVAAEMYPNAVPGGVAVTAYTLSRDRQWDIDCLDACAVRWIPVLSNGRPNVAGGSNAKDVGLVIQPDGTHQVTCEGEPLYLYSAEQPIFPTPAAPQTTGTAGNGNGLWGWGGRFPVVNPW